MTRAPRPRRRFAIVLTVAFIALALAPGFSATTLATGYMVDVRDIAGNAGRTYSTEVCGILIGMVGAA